MRNDVHISNGVNDIWRTWMTFKVMHLLQVF